MIPGERFGRSAVRHFRHAAAQAGTTWKVRAFAFYCGHRIVRSVHTLYSCLPIFFYGFVSPMISRQSYHVSFYATARNPVDYSSRASSSEDVSSSIRGVVALTSAKRLGISDGWKRNALVIIYLHQLLTISTISRRKWTTRNCCIC